ncbi:MAG: hypothetical protein U0694_09295 [Anaerolineae bacterium]
MDTPHKLTHPIVRLGAASSGALSLPASDPTPSQMSAPRGVFMRDDLLIVADSGNHRVLIWHGIPVEDGQAADVVLGQPDFYSQGIHEMHIPVGVLVVEDRLFVVDSGHHRVLVWNHLPQRHYQPPDFVLGQADLASVELNRGQAVSAIGLHSPGGIAAVAGWFYIADTGNRRVLAWRGIPETESTS